MLLEAEEEKGAQTQVDERRDSGADDEVLRGYFAFRLQLRAVRPSSEIAPRHEVIIHN